MSNKKNEELTMYDQLSNWDLPCPYCGRTGICLARFYLEQAERSVSDELFHESNEESEGRL